MNFLNAFWLKTWALPVRGAVQASTMGALTPAFDQPMTLPFAPTVLILAAGRSERFRSASGGLDKLEADLGGRRVRDWVLAAVQSSGLPWHVVERSHTAHLSRPGMGDSIACGVAATAYAPAWLVLPADLPLVQARTLLQVAQALSTQAVVVPTWQGERGHPVGFAAVCRDELLALSGDSGARAVVQRHGAYLLPVNDGGCVFDVDTPEALEAARQRMVANAQAPL